jgi:hypothetical protein
MLKNRVQEIAGNTSVAQGYDTVDHVIGACRLCWKVLVMAFVLESCVPGKEHGRAACISRLCKLSYPVETERISCLNVCETPSLIFSLELNSSV